MAFSCLLSVLVRTLSKRERLAHKTTTHENATRSFINKVFLRRVGFFFFVCAFFSGISVDADVGFDRQKTKKGEKKTKKSCLPRGANI